MENNIYELLYMARSNDDLAYEMMYEQLLPIFGHLYQQAGYLCQMCEYGECMSICRLTMMTAVRQYRSDTGLQFPNFVYLCCKRALLNEVRAVKRDHYYNGEMHFSFDYQLGQDQMTCLSDIYQTQSVFTDEEMILRSLTLESILEKYATEQEREIFDLYRKGYSYKEISRLLDMPYKRVDNILQTLKKTIGELADS